MSNGSGIHQERMNPDYPNLFSRQNQEIRPTMSSGLTYFSNSSPLT